MKPKKDTNQKNKKQASSPNVKRSVRYMSPPATRTNFSMLTENDPASLEERMKRFKIVQTFSPPPQSRKVMDFGNRSGGKRDSEHNPLVLSTLPNL